MGHALNERIIDPLVDTIVAFTTAVDRDQRSPERHEGISPRLGAAAVSQALLPFPSGVPPMAPSHPEPPRTTEDGRDEITNRG